MQQCFTVKNVIAIERKKNRKATDLHCIVEGDTSRASVPTDSASEHGFDVAAGGVVLKKKWGTPETRLRQRFTVTYNINSAVLKLSFTALQ